MNADKLGWIELLDWNSKFWLKFWLCVLLLLSRRKPKSFKLDYSKCSSCILYNMCAVCVSLFPFVCAHLYVSMFLYINGSALKPGLISIRYSRLLSYIYNWTNCMEIVKRRKAKNERRDERKNCVWERKIERQQQCFVWMSIA